VGECAEHNGKVYGLVAPLYEQGKVLADYLTGKVNNQQALYLVHKEVQLNHILYHCVLRIHPRHRYVTSLKVSGCDLYSAGQIVEDDTVHGIEIFNSVDNIYKKVYLSEYSPLMIHVFSSYYKILNHHLYRHIKRHLLLDHHLDRRRRKWNFNSRYA
jgi:NAD(P)H-nitrite reductase large subunit